MNRVIREGDGNGGVVSAATENGFTWRPGFREKADGGIGYGLCGLRDCGARLTLVADEAVEITPAAVQPNVYLLPYTSRLVPMFDGTGWTLYDIGDAGLTNVLLNATTNPAAVVAASCYDLFAWRNFTTGVNYLTRGPVWTSLHSRSAGTALARNQGYLANAVDILNGPLAGFGLYVGTFATDPAATAVSWVPGTAAAGGGAAQLNLWNYYNRRRVFTTVADATGGGNAYTLAALQQADASANNRITFVNGVSEDGWCATYKTSIHLLAAAAGYGEVGIGFDQIAAYDSDPARLTTPMAGALTGSVSTHFGQDPGVAGLQGQRYVQALEGGDGANANVFNVNGMAMLSLDFTM